MSFSKPSVIASSVSLLAALCLAPTPGWARDGRDRGGADEIIHFMAPLEPSSDAVIYEMAPMKPVKGATAKAHQSAPGTVKQADKPAPPFEPSVAAKPAMTPEKEAAAAQPPLREAPAAEAPALSATAGEQPVAAQSPAEPVVEAPALVEPAPIGAPIMSLNPPRKALAAMKEPATPFKGHVATLQGESSAPSLTPKLESLAPAPSPELAPATSPELAPAASPEVAAAAPSEERAEAPLEQPQAAPTAGASEEAVDAKPAASGGRIAALLAEGQAGPAEIRLGDGATMWLPAGRVFLPTEAAKKLAQAAGLDWRPAMQGIVAPAGGDLQWVAPIELINDGHIPIGDPAALAPEKLLSAFQASLPEVNAQRAQGGQAPAALDGWLAPPALNEKHRLSGCVNVSTTNDQSGVDKFFNCEAWALGRHGAIKVGLANGAELAARLKDEAAALADTIAFDRDKAYDAFDPASDKSAPYTAADLLTRDVTAKVGAAPASVEAPAPSDWLSMLFYPAVFGVGALALYALLKRRRDAENATPAPRLARLVGQVDETPRETADQGAAGAPTSLFARLLPTVHARFEKKAPSAPLSEESVSDAETSAPEEPESQTASPSLFARVLPTLHARFAKNAATAPAAAETAPIEDEPALTPEPTAKEPPKSAVGALIGKISALRARDRQGTKSATPANDLDEPATALKKVAALMRRKSDEPAPAPINLSRAIRAPRNMGAATALAMEPVETLVVENETPQAAEPEATLIEPQLIEPNTAFPFQPAAEVETAQEVEIRQAPEAPAPQAGNEAEVLSPSATESENFGLIEPGEPRAPAPIDEDSTRDLEH